jgi:hypothetical protein
MSTVSAFGRPSLSSSATICCKNLHLEPEPRCNRPLLRLGFFFVTKLATLLYRNEAGQNEGGSLSAPKSAARSFIVEAINLH